MEFVREKVASGDWPLGEPLPKILALADQFSASDHTVTLALNHLEHEGVIHRKGKTRRVGPRPTERRVSLVSKPPFILILQRSWSDWQGLCNGDRTERFATAFWGEAERMGIELLPVVGREDDPYVQAKHSYIAGKQAVMQYLRAHEKHYLGTLLSTPSPDPADAGMLDWVKRLIALGKPIVYFDHKEQNILGEFRHPLLTRCSPSDAKVVPCAVEVLSAYGHRCVGFPVDETVEWEMQRLARLQAEASRHVPPLTLVSQSRNRSVSPDRRMLNQVLAKLKGVSDLAEEGRAAVLDDVVRTHPVSAWMAPLFATPGLTAIMVPNDATGRFVYEWLSALRVSMPDRFSLLSFDNYRGNKALPMTSVDFGFGQLGYCAFHAILRTIRIATDRSGTVWARPFVAHRASLGPACRT